MAKLDEDDEEIASEVKARARRARELEKALAVATRAPVEAAAFVAQAEAIVRERLANLGAELARRPEASRDLYREILDGWTLTPGRNDERPRRVIVEGAVVLGKAAVTPPGRSLVGTRG